MDELSFFQHGSKWIRADFHLHTKRDREFIYAGDDNDFIKDYISALKTANIRVGIITNHNKFDREEFKNLRKAAKKENIYLLPGVELSIKDGANGIHTLIVFQEDWIDNQANKDHINSFIELTFAGQTNYDNSNSRSNHDIIDTIRELDKFQKEYFMIFAHVENTSGLWHELKDGRITELGKKEEFRCRTAAFQKVKPSETKEKVIAWLEGWYPSEVEGSDPKSIEQVGKGEKSYIKIGAFTFEAIQFALKPKAERLLKSEIQKLKHTWIRSISFDGGIFDKTRIDFSEEMNCLIGIRGSGKSALLECLRYALKLPLPSNTEDYRYKVDLVDFALESGGKIVVEIEDASGNIYEIRRILNHNSDVYFNDVLQPGISIPLKDPLFFGQKELVKRGEGSERELVSRLMGTKLDNVRKEIRMQHQKVLDVLNSLDKFQSLDELEQEYLNKKRTTEFKLDLFKKYGIEKQLNRQVVFNADVTNSQRVVTAIDTFINSFDLFLNEQSSELASLAKLESEENADTMLSINALMEKIRKVPDAIMKFLNDTRQCSTELHEKLSDLEQRRDLLKEEFASIERTLNEQLQSSGEKGIRPDDFVKLNTELQNAKLALEEIAKNRVRKNNIQDELRKELRSLSNLWHTEYKMIEAEILKLNDSQKALKIIPIFKGDKEIFKNEMITQFRGSHLRESTHKNISEKYADFISIFDSLDSVCSELGESGDVFRKYFTDNRATLLTWQVPNSFHIKYHGKELSEHSLGQRASALILFILSQSDNDVIVIDQPEDDLDNQTIFEDVIKQVRAVKQNIQFIFATHNANFPVLGDTEQVGACSFVDSNTVLKVGSIDDPTIQKAIVSIMEGGHEAFTRRKEIYQQWKQ